MRFHQYCLAMYTTKKKKKTKQKHPNNFKCEIINRKKQKKTVNISKKKV